MKNGKSRSKRENENRNKGKGKLPSFTSPSPLLGDGGTMGDAVDHGDCTPDVALVAELGVPVGKG